MAGLMGVEGSKDKTGSQCPVGDTLLSMTQATQPLKFLCSSLPGFTIHLIRGSVKCSREFSCQGSTTLQNQCNWWCSTRVHWGRWTCRFSLQKENSHANGGLNSPFKFEDDFLLFFLLFVGISSCCCVCAAGSNSLLFRKILLASNMSQHQKNSFVQWHTHRRKYDSALFCLGRFHSPEKGLSEIRVCQ